MEDWARILLLILGNTEDTPERLGLQKGLAALKQLESLRKWEEGLLPIDAVRE
jgi:hypothetical protein